MLQWTWGSRYLFKLVFMFSPYKYPEVELLDHMVVLFLVFWGNSILFSIVVVPIYISPYSAQGFPFLHILANTCYFLFDDSHSNECEVIPHCGFDLHFPGDWWCWVSFHVPVSQLYVFFGKMSIQILCPFFSWIIFFAVELCDYIFWLLIPHQIYDLQISSRLPFYFIDDFLWCTESF